MMRNLKSRSQAGFSLLEMLMVVFILSLVMAGVFTQIDRMQKRYNNEEQRLDITQEGREFFDQIVRDLHQAGWPNSKMYGTGTLTTPVVNDSRNAVGLVKFAYDEIWFEGDIDGDGTVETVNYKLRPDASGNCPCTLARSALPKANSTAPTAQTVSYNTEIGNVVNSGGANGGAKGTAGYTISGYSPSASGSVSNNLLYASYKTAPLFLAYDSSGNEVAPTTDPTTLKTIRTLKINLNLLTSRADLQTNRMPAVTYAASVRLPAN